MDFNMLARAAKLVALFGFVLPWVVVSCSGTEIAAATGIELMTGDIKPAGPFADQQQGPGQDADPHLPTILAFGVILIGLGASFVQPARIAAVALIAFALAGAGLSAYAIEDLRGGFERAIQEQQQSQGPAAPQSALFTAQDERNLERAVAGMIKVEARAGFWVTIAALAAAAILGLLTLARREERAPDSS